VRSLAALLVGVLLAAVPGEAGADGALVNVSATVLSRSNCRFRRNAAPVLAFGSLDPFSAADAAASATIDFRCTGSAQPAVFAITDDDGLYETGANANRMRHTANPSEYLPYEFSVSPSSGSVPRNTWIPLTITGVVRAVHVQDAAAGTYTDTVTLSINP